MHNLIVGNSFSGKSNLAKCFAHRFANSGKEVLVYDPLKSNGWPKNAKKYASAAQFVAAFWEHRSHYVFIDESKILFDQERTEAERIAFQGRHNGNLVFFIGQRTASMIPPNARNQCSRVFAFKQQLDDAKTLAAEYGREMLECVNLGKGEFLATDGFSTLSGRMLYDGCTDWPRAGEPPAYTLENRCAKEISVDA